MIFVFQQNESFADIHSHLIPFVDDGASDIEDSKRLILEEHKQGVRLLVLTPHLRDGFFDTPIDVIQKHFDELKKWVVESDIKGLDLYLSREYHCDKRLEALLDGYANGSETIVFEGKEYKPQKEIQPFGTGRCILLEFSTSLMNIDEVERFVRKAVNAGFKPIIAHAERYPIVQKNVHILDDIKALGASIQVNADALLGLEGKETCSSARKLAVEGIADIVASDAHDLEQRMPRLEKCYRYLKRRVGEEKAASLIRDKAYQLIK